MKPDVPARSAWECHAYLARLPCECAATGLDVTEVAACDGRWDFATTCRQCGRARRFTFLAPAQPPPYPAFGGSEPSNLMGPGDFLSIGQQAAMPVPAEPDGLTEAEVRQAYERIEVAVAAVEEVLKFPADQYDRRLVLSTLGAYRRLLATYSRVA